jgi:hypothetical protein
MSVRRFAEGAPRVKRELGMLLIALVFAQGCSSGPGVTGPSTPAATPSSTPFTGPVEGTISSTPSPTPSPSPARGSPSGDSTASG